MEHWVVSTDNFRRFFDQNFVLGGLWYCFRVKSEVRCASCIILLENGFHEKYKLTCERLLVDSEGPKGVHAKCTIILEPVVRAHRLKTELIISWNPTLCQYIPSDSRNTSFEWQSRKAMVPVPHFGHPLPITSGHFLIRVSFFTSVSGQAVSRLWSTGSSLYLDPSKESDNKSLVLTYSMLW